MSEQLDVYTYALGKSTVEHFSVGSTGREWIAPCIVPGCPSRHDAFSVQPEGKHTGRWAGYGAWMCRQCWDPSEIVAVAYGPERGTRRKRGWGTLADLVMACEQISYREAERFILAYEGVVIPMAARPALHKPKTDAVWFTEAMEYLANTRYADAASRELTTNYLASRGLTLTTARVLEYGYSLDPVPQEDGTFRKMPFLVIPWYENKEAGTLYRTINRRYLAPLPGQKEKYRFRGGSTHDALYLGECLKDKRPTFLVESELDAATILQEAGDLVNVVATGSTAGGRNAVNEGRLRRQLFVFVAFDADADGEKASIHWLKQLDPSKSIRYRPLLHDANDMHMHPDVSISVRQWVEEALATFLPTALTGTPAPQPEPVQSSSIQEEVPIDPDVPAQEDEVQVPGNPSLEGDFYLLWGKLKQGNVLYDGEFLPRMQYLTCIQQLLITDPDKARIEIEYRLANNNGGAK